MFCPCCHKKEGTQICGKHLFVHDQIYCLVVIRKAFRNQATFLNQKTRELLSEIRRSRFWLNT